MCSICGIERIYWKNGSCRACGGCVGCWAREYTNKVNRLCDRCDCSECHEIRASWGNEGKRYCSRCFVLKFPDKLCSHCKKNRASVFTALERRKATLCDKCASTVSNMRCWWCDSYTRGHVRRDASGDFSYAACRLCVNGRCCFNGKCSPPRPCGKCRHERQQPQGDFYFTQEPRFYYALAISNRKRNRNPRLLSPEIECAGVRYAHIAHNEPASMAKYGQCICTVCYTVRLREIHNLIKQIGGSIVTDDSLGDGGFEINMPPSGGDFFLDNTQRVSDLLSKSMAYVSNNCGTHIHIDARDLDYAAMRRFLLAYARVEGGLVAMQPIMRIQGHHSVPCGRKYLTPEFILPQAAKQADGLPSSWGKSLRHSLAEAVFVKEYDRPPRLLRGDHREINARYDAMNVQSWYYRGTLECRLHSGTIDAQKIQQWGMLLAGLVDTTIAMKESEILSMPVQTPKENLIALTPSRTHEYIQNRWAAFETQHRRK